MFDSSTSALIASAPALDGLDQAGLAKELTKAYSTIVSLRMRLRRANESPDFPGELQRILNLLGPLAHAQEAFAALGPGRENRASAAFVAATAHQLRFAAELLQSTREKVTEVSVAAI